MKKGVFAAFAASREETVFVSPQWMRAYTRSWDPGPASAGLITKEVFYDGTQ